MIKLPCWPNKLPFQQNGWPYESWDLCLKGPAHAHSLWNSEAATPKEFCEQILEDMKMVFERRWMTSPDEEKREVIAEVSLGWLLKATQQEVESLLASKISQTMMEKS